MNNSKRILLFFVLPTLAPLILPPQTLVQGIGVVITAAALLIASGTFLYQGRSLALTLMIFLQGLNFIVRMMLFFSHSVSAQNVVDIPFAITSLLSMGLSIYILFRLDQVDIHAQMRS